MRTVSVFNRTEGLSEVNARPAPLIYPTGLNLPRKAVVGFILIIALVCFEMFNFDTTRYALRSLLGDVNFVGLSWAGILAIAFCAIDFAGLARLFTPAQGKEEPKAIWYLMGAWLLGATMNAIMTWWAISLTLLSHEFGNEVLNREQLLQIVPIFLAALVWLTRILFIGAFSVAGEHIFDLAGNQDGQAQARPRPSATREASLPSAPQREPRPAPPASRPLPGAGTVRQHPAPARQPARGQRRPPVPGRPQPAPLGMQASRRER